MLRPSSLPPQAPTSGYRRIRKPLFDEIRSLAGRITPDRRRDSESIPRLEELPLEILHQIFVYASTDGGPTACSLSLVSKRIHAASRATHFTSVSLTTGSMDALSKFLEHFHRAQETAIAQRCHKPRVRHLCLVVDPLTSDHLDVFNPLEASRRYILQELQDMQLDNATRAARAASVAALEEQYYTAVGGLLSSVATDLETLCLFRLKKGSIGCPDFPEQLHIARQDFPQLRDLWYNYDMPPLIFTTTSHQPLIPFPVLTRLHVLEPMSADFRRWRWSAPKMDSLRITVDYEAIERRSPRAPGPFLTNLQRTLEYPNWPVGEPIHILSAGRDSLDRDESYTKRYDWWAGKFRNVIDHAGSRAVFVPHYAFEDVVADACIDHYAPLPKLMRQDWLARISVGSVGDRDGVYAKDFWLKHTQRDCELLPNVRRFAVRRKNPTDVRVMPFVRWHREVEMESVVSQ